MTLILNPINGTAQALNSDGLNSNAFIPSQYRPHANMVFPVYVYDNGAKQSQTGILNTNGTIF